jgi:putative sterol carrier protein
MVQTDEIIKKIEARLAKIDPNDRKVLHTYKFILTDDAGTVVRTWILDLKNVKVYQGTDAAECTLTMKDSVFFQICTGALDSTKALNDDLIDVDGNLELITLLKPFITSL